MEDGYHLFLLYCLAVHFRCGEHIRNMFVIPCIIQCSSTPSENTFTVQLFIIDVQASRCRLDQRSYMMILRPFRNTYSHALSQFQNRIRLILVNSKNKVIAGQTSNKFIITYKGHQIFCIPDKDCISLLLSELFIRECSVSEIKADSIVIRQCSVRSDPVNKRPEARSIRESGHNIGLGSLLNEHILKIMYAVIFVVEAVVYRYRHLPAAVITAAGTIDMS